MNNTTFARGLKTLCCCAVTVAILSPPTLAATVSGTITNSANVTALSGAEIMFVADGDTSRTFSAADGSYAIELDISPLDVAETPRPQEFVLHQNFPNPFNPSTMIEFELLEPDTVALTVYNVMGQTVRKLVSGQVAAGFHTVAWDGRDDSGMSVSAGVYLYRLSTGGQSVTKKMLLLDGGMHSSSGVSVAASPVYVAPVAEKRSVTPRDFVMAVKLDGYLLYEDYHFSVAADKAVDVAMEEKSGATVSGELLYLEDSNCSKENWNGVIDPIEVIVYDTNDYSVPIAVETLQYPDATYEITGLPEAVVDIVYQCDDMISEKLSVIQLTSGKNQLESVTMIIAYNQEAYYTWFLVAFNYAFRLKKAYDSIDVAESIVNEYNSDISSISYHEMFDITFYRCFFNVPDYSSMTSITITQILHNDIRIATCSPAFIVSPDKQ